MSVSPNNIFGLSKNNECKPLNLRRASPSRISLIANDIARKNSETVACLDFQVCHGLITLEQFQKEQATLLNELCIYESEGKEIPIVFSAPTEGAIRRACDYRSVKRQLTKIANEERVNDEAKKALIGGRTTQLYCSDQTLNFRKAQEEQAHDALESFYVRRTGTNQVTTLAEIAKNQEYRRFNQLFHISKNLQSIAEDSKLDSYFVTLTAPGNYHPNPASGKKSYNQERLRNAHTYIQDRWKLIRSRLAKSGFPLSILTMFGMRFVEVHKDGCAHWHMLIFTTKEIFEEFQKHANELFPSRSQWDHILIDNEKGEASSYLFKYIAKAVDSSKFNDQRLKSDDQDLIRVENDQASMSHADRVVASLRAQGIRQYQCFGIGSAMTKYRLINKIVESTDIFQSAEVREALSACRMYNHGTKEKESRNLLGFKGLITEFADKINVVKQVYMNRFGEEKLRITALEFDCGYRYELPQYEIARSSSGFAQEEELEAYMPYLSEDDDLDRLERECFISQLRASNEDTLDDCFFKEQKSTVTVIYSYPSKAYCPGRADKKRPKASDLLRIVRDVSPQHSLVKYIDINPPPNRPLSTENLMQLLSCPP